MAQPNPNPRHLMGMMFRAHPWHGISIGEDAPKILNAYIETVPSDTVKYEIDKVTGFLRVDRPQKFSNICPTLYGFIPQTYCSESVAELCMQRSGRTGIVGDHDPLDICVLTEKLIPHGDILLRAIPIGGIRMIDRGEADDKIIAVMNNDALYGRWTDISDCPESFLDRLMHYFLTYKDLPDAKKRNCEITGLYDRQEAEEVIRRCQGDYKKHFPDSYNYLSSHL